MNSASLILILVSVSLSVLAQLLLKQGMSSNSMQHVFVDGYFIGAVKIVTNLYVFSGLMAYVSSAAVWLGVLSKIDVSTAYPFVGLGFIGTMLFAALFLNEPLTLYKILGTLLIVIGVILIAK